MDKKPKGKKTPTGSPALPPMPFRPDKSTTDLSELLAVHLRPLVEQMANVNTKLDSLQQQMNGLVQKTQTNFETTQKLTKKIDKCEKTVDGITKDKANMEKQVIQLQMEKASYYLRFQGIPEEQSGENLKDTVVKMLANGVDIPEAEMEKEIDILYRTHTAFVKRNNLPGEVMVKFSRRQTRDQILRSVRDRPLKIENISVETLKDIPFEVRKRRIQYKPLVAFLQEKKITYKWIFPEGLAFEYNGHKKRIDSKEKVKAFLDPQKAHKQKQQKATTKEGEEKRESDKEEETEDGEISSESCSGDSDQELGAAAPRAHKDSKYELRQRKQRKK